MAVQLQITNPHGSYLPVWEKFLQLMEHKSRCHPNPLMYPVDKEIDAALEIYGAWTNWDDLQDPLWFPDEEHRVAFMLAYS